MDTLTLRAMHPRMWWRRYPVSPEWDAAVLAALDSGEAPEVNHDFCHVGLSGLMIWIANWPYAYGRPVLRKPSGGLNVLNLLPTPVTAVRLHDLVGDQEANSKARALASRDADLRAAIRPHRLRNRT